ncbi:hypothetical protein JCM6294_3255 [Bacteroides pyogenes DSM 20611 = JCM 6294]|uniref:Uncharacterized protein n=1 Tax=Bacteroides pyogenes DSM 20611 = JCM 6294 TaxID=1121100 RepID=W4PJW6_9BACE|nr:hypothetical protein JCM6294_3255 [Bacteroides pyogenes DSM 20611 = JCM 6294]
MVFTARSDFPICAAISFCVALLFSTDTCSFHKYYMIVCKYSKYYCIRNKMSMYKAQTFTSRDFVIT